MLGRAREIVRASFDFAMRVGPHYAKYLLMMTAQNQHKMSDMVIECELRRCWSEVERDIRHGIQPSRRVSNYIAELTDEQNRRAA